LESLRRDATYPKQQFELDSDMGRELLDEATDLARFALDYTRRERA
jgi:hypothetical protein